jgi:uncharacterized protein YyaL (SSP411 family)
MDDVLPSGAATAALALSRFAVLLQEEKYRLIAEKALILAQPHLEHYPQYVPTLLSLQAEHIQGLSTVILYGAAAELEQAQKLCLKYYQVDRFVFPIIHRKNLPKEFAHYISEDPLSVYICAGKVCGARLNELGDLAQYLEK